MTEADGSGGVLADRYDLREKIGEGGFATVYRAVDTRSGEVVAVKVPNYEGSNNDEDVIDRYFGRESQTLARIESVGGHPNVVTLHDRGTVEGTEYLVVEYVDGYDLDEAIDKTGPLGEDLVEQVRQVGIDLCDAMSFLHGSEIVYRDLKPDNVMLTAADGGPRPVLVDFNTATGFDAQGSVDDSKTSILGPYKPPEIAEADRSNVRQGPWSDVYSIGKILLFLLKGAVPEKDGVNPRNLGVDCDQYLAAIVEKATQASYDRRYRNATTMKRVLEARNPSTPPEAAVTDLQTGEQYTIHPGDTIGRRSSAGPTPSIPIEDDGQYVSTVQVQFDVMSDERDGWADDEDWLLHDRSLNGTYVGTDDGWQRVLSEEGRDRLRSQGETPTDRRGAAPPTEYPLSNGDLIALVHPSYDTAFRFEV